MPPVTPAHLGNGVASPGPLDVDGVLEGPDNEVLELFDEQHSDFEERFISIGPIHVGLVLVVWTERDEGVVRLISARVATPAEQRLYYRHLEQT